MKSDNEKAAAFIDSLGREERVEFWAGVIHELTIFGRGSYTIGSPGLDHPERLRVINELQHLVSGHILRTLSDSSFIYPTKMLVDAFLDPNSTGNHTGEVSHAFIHALGYATNRRAGDHK